MPSKRFLNFGGYHPVNDRGYWTVAKLHDISNSIESGAISPSLYDGILFDIEYCDANLLSSFLNCFAMASPKDSLLLLQ